MRTQRRARCLVLLFPVLMTARTGATPPDPSNDSSPVQTSVCEVLVNPGMFDGRMVQFRATVNSGFEVFAVEDPENPACGRIWLSYGGGGPTASVSFGLSTPRVQRPPIVLHRDRHFRRFRKMLDAEVYPRTRNVTCASCPRYRVSAVMMGRLDAAGTGRGFGHMNAYSARLALQRVRAVQAADLAAQYDPSEFSVTPVAYPAGRVSGKVTVEGKPVVDAMVTLEPLREDLPGVHTLTEWTDARGRFAFSDVPPATYLAGVNLDSPPSAKVPFPATWFPGTVDHDSAEPLTIEDGDRRRISIPLGAALEVWRIPVRVLWPDGTPVVNANVWLKETGNPYAVVGGSVSHTDAEGRFVLLGLHGPDYSIGASLYKKPRYWPYCSESILLRAGTEILAPFTLVLSREGDACRP